MSSFVLSGLSDNQFIILVYQCTRHVAGLISGTWCHKGLYRSGGQFLVLRPGITTAAKTLLCVLNLHVVVSLTPASICADTIKPEGDPKLERWKILVQQTRQSIKEHNLEKARKSAEEAIEECKRNRTCEPQLAESLRDLGDVQERSGDINNAIGSYEESLKLRTKLFGKNSVSLEPVILRLIVLLKNRSGDNKQRIALVQQLAVIRRQALPADSPLIIGPLWDLAVSLKKTENWAETASVLHQLADLRAITSTDPDTTAYYYLEAGICETKTPGVSEAESILSKALQFYQTKNKSPDIGACYYFLALCAVKQGQGARAIEQFENCIAAHGRFGDSLFYPYASGALISAGREYTKQRQFDKAAHVLHESLRFYEKTYGPNSRVLRGVCKALAEMYETQGNTQQAQFYRTKIDRLQKNTPQYPAASSIGAQVTTDPKGM